MILDSIRGAKSVNWEENRELGVVRLHIFNSRISNSRKIPGPKKRELGGYTVFRTFLRLTFYNHDDMRYAQKSIIII